MNPKSTIPLSSSVRQLLASGFALRNAFLLGVLCVLPSSLCLAQEVDAELVGVWAGIDSQGEQVAYVLEEDGSASVLKNGDAELLSDESTSVKWTVRWRNDGYGDLDLTIEMVNLDIPKIEVRYLVAWTDQGALRIRSGGASGERPESLSPMDDAMQMTLTRL